MSDEKVVTVPRATLEVAMASLTLWGTHTEYDYPGDAPEPCGQWCDICKQHIDDEDHALGHSETCPINVLRLQLEQ